MKSKKMVLNVVFLLCELIVSILWLICFFIFSEEFPKNSYFIISFLCFFMLFLFNLKSFIKEYLRNSANKE